MSGLKNDNENFYCYAKCATVWVYGRIYSWCKKGPFMGNQKFGEILLPWFFASLISLSIPVVLIYLSRYFSSMIDPLDYDKHLSIANQLYIYWSASLPYILVFLPLAVYWGTGIVFTLKFPYRKSGWRTIAAKVLLVLSLAAIFFIPTLLSSAWCLAFKKNLAPPRFLEEGFNRPWLDVPVLSDTMEWALFLPLVCFGLAFLSFLLRPNRYAGVIWLSCPFIFTLLLISHHWLID
jgi:hypothetical protein